MKTVTIDSSVIVASLLEKEPRHRQALKIWENVIQGKYFAVMPSTVFVEVVAAIRRRTGSEELATQTKNALSSIDSLSFVSLDDTTANEAAQLAIKTGVRGMDAFVIQTAIEFGAELITFDNEMLEKASSVLKHPPKSK